MSVRPARPGDLEVWVEMRAELWPDATPAEHRRDAEKILAGKDDTTVFLAVSSKGELVGFIELSTRPYAEGCRTSPVGYVEGWYMKPGHRRQGHGADMLRAAEQWARKRGCKEMASDTEADNRLSQTVHKRLGYTEVATIVAFRKQL